MFFIAAKIFWALFQPSNLAAILAAGGLITLMIWRRLGLALLAMAAMLLVIFGILPTDQWLIAPLEARFAQPAEDVIKSAAGLIILGGSEDPRMSRARGEPSLGFEAARLAGAAALAHRVPEKPIIYTGGYREPGGMTQADVARAYLLSVGIAEKRLMLEDQSQDTAENAIYTQKILGQHAAQPWLIVTSAFHMPRAVAAFRRAGMTVIPYPVAYRGTGDGKVRWVLDVTTTMRVSDLAVHEWVGLLAYYLTGRSDELFPAP